MKNYNIYSYLLTLIITVSLTSCVTVPEVLQGEFLDITPSQAKSKQVFNEKVRWSGLILQTINKKNSTCFEIVETQTNQSLKPTSVIPKDGSRFIACKTGFLEPVAFDKRMVTITGNISGYTNQKVGEYDYQYPVLDTDLIYIWRNNSNRYTFSGFNHFSRISNFSCMYNNHAHFCYP